MFCMDLFTLWSSLFESGKYIWLSTEKEFIILFELPKKVIATFIKLKYSLEVLHHSKSLKQNVIGNTKYLTPECFALWSRNFWSEQTCFHLRSRLSYFGGLFAVVLPQIAQKCQKKTSVNNWMLPDMDFFKKLPSLHNLGVNFKKFFGKSDLVALQNRTI